VRQVGDWVQEFKHRAANVRTRLKYMCGRHGLHYAHFGLLFAPIDANREFGTSDLYRRS
jgi:hypothetical protein